MTKICYKIVDKKGEDYYYLFHGINKSKKIQVNKWLTAERKIVSDGSNSSKYESGFHVLLSYEDTEKYLQSFKNTKNRAIIKVVASGLRKKEHSRSNVYLANKMKLEL